MKKAAQRQADAFDFEKEIEDDCLEIVVDGNVQNCLQMLQLDFDDSLMVA